MEADTGSQQVADSGSIELTPGSVADSVVASVDEALGSWDQSAVQKSVAEAVALRMAFLAQFPVTAWSDLALDRYALGQQIEGGTACWWLEFKTRPVASMSGGSATKHLIWRGADGEWKFPHDYASVDDAWTAVRSGFIQMFELADEDRFDEIDGIAALSGAAALRTKALFMYFPEFLLPVCSKAHVDHFLQVLGDSGSSYSPVNANRRLMDILRQIPSLTDLTTQELGFFLYHWADPRNTVRVVKIAPGEQAKYWGDCLDGGYICVGWDAVGDLTQYADKAQFREAFGEHFPYNGNKAQVTRKANEIWTLMELEPGDKVIANKGASEVLAVGTVGTDGYRWNEERNELRHTLTVDWDTSFARKIQPVPTWQTTTVAKVPATLYSQIIGSHWPPPVEVDPALLEIEAALERRGQVILYGPPGTGKTYTARRAAVWFLFGGSKSPEAASPLSDPALLTKQEHLLSTASKGNRLTRITFHPSYTYEDFVEGFRPTGATSSGLALVLTDGLFKQACANARSNPTSPHLLLIDEINRGNIPKVFGELITLIEKDKRGLTVRLPQSGEEFSVPANLYIIGTMNTADRSIHLLDTALRRRFAFVELLPDPEPLRGVTAGPLAVDVLIENLNDHIRRRAGRERQVGHALFFDQGQPVGTSEAFASVFRLELLPLLQEYLYEDYKELGRLLGEQIIDSELERPTPIVDDPEALCAALAAQFDAKAAN